MELSSEDKIEQIKKLAKYIHPTNKRFQFDWTCKGSDGALLEIADGNKIIIHSWLESYHNGDAYGKSSVEISDLKEREVIINKLYSKVVNDAINKSNKEIELEEEKKLAEEKRHRAITRLISNGVVDFFVES